MENKNNVEIICDKFLPIEVINKILVMRPTHPIAKLIKPIIKEYRLDLIYRMSNGRTFDTYFFYWYYDAYPYKEEWNESDDFEDIITMKSFLLGTVILAIKKMMV